MPSKMATKNETKAEKFEKWKNRFCILFVGLALLCGESFVDWFMKASNISQVIVSLLFFALFFLFLNEIEKQQRRSN